MKQSEKSVPAHLQQYVCEQHYDQYSPIDHAVWRYVMRQNHHFLKDVAHPAYVEGLLSSGINIEAIPRVEEMNACLARSGWGAATIDGLIPGVAFFDFQGHGILPIATDIRRVEHIEYTPAPDIIHEAAGHAPILFDAKYAEYVKLFGKIGAKAFATKEEHEAFEAVRHLTIVMEDRNSTEEEIAEAKRLVEEKQTAITDISEAEQISRLFWWTVEYGLIGDVNNPKIYGAGLLSSVGESKQCLTDSVKKIPFSIEACINTPYDVTTMQPQLFVCQSFDELIESIEKFADTLAVRTGGTAGLNKAVRSQNTATAVFNSGIQVTGIIHELLNDENGEAIYIKTAGPTALSINGKELVGHSKAVHADGFGTPVGLLQGDISLEECSDELLEALGIVVGKQVCLPFKSGVKVNGIVKHIVKHENKVALISFTDCNVSLQDIVLFESSWGTYDMTVGSSIISVFAGAADPQSYFQPVEMLENKTSSQRTLSQLEQLYLHVRALREQKEWNENSATLVASILDTLRVSHKTEWLLRLEILELFHMYNVETTETHKLQEELLELAKHEKVRNLIQNGLQLLPLAQEL
ncbi:aromatic amino acid hydroxylase [Bacillus sp. 165]|uniref:aromatic amino acid hydroxylase n=1 Tax=Bacillus sp. 165 TaxID=1529117 RepID=UPI001ADAA0F9|nr:aromatic amino acid hydroxylase [Bacillus sp. 165]MBO9131179.1 aromatic amino acid hydroxylase [Bacillus sp. 165]